jgi:D-Tyr-tRNAtyr deacylase
MNLSLLDMQGERLIVSQFTLLGDCRKGRRPSFTEAEDPNLAKRFRITSSSRLRKRSNASTRENSRPLC